MTPWGARFLPLCCSLLFLLQDHVSSGNIIAAVGTDVTLRCNYDAQKYGRLYGCWGRGAIPSRGCANEVIRSDGTSVISRQSRRYLLMGNLAWGDVSLTIRQVEESDSGIYGCRVEIPGWFNDHKHEQKLTVVAVPPSPLKVEVKEVKERTVTIQWSLVFNGGRPITSYMVQLKNNQAFWNTAVVTELHNPALTQVMLMGLRPAKTYNLRMFSTNRIGQSDSSNVLTITTKEAEPEGSPQDLKLEALSSRSIRVTWKPPKAELRNGVLRSYTVSYRTLNQGSRQPSPLMHKTVSATREEESLTLTDLMPSTQYSVLIRAATNAGGGPHTVALCSTPDEVPPSPLKVEVKEVKERTVTVQWSPVFNGGRPITSYMVQLKNNQAFWNTAVVTELHNPALTQVTLMGLRPAKTYNLRMFAHNIIGQSNSSNVLTITTKEAEPEGSPQDLKLEALSSRSIRATWKPPKAELRNGVLRSYTVSYRTLNQGSRQPSPLMHKTVSATREEESLTLTDLMPSTQYSVLIRAATNAGGGPHAVALCSTPDEVPPSPLKVEVKEVKERTVTVQWSPVFNGGRPITSYMVQLKNNQAFWNTAVVTELHNPALTQVTLMDLRPAKTYNLRMFAHNIIGQSNSSNVLTITTKEAEPEGSPQDLKLEALSSRSIRATWKPPKAELRNGVLRSYTVSYRTLNQGSRQPSLLMHKTVSATREEESLTLTDLMPSTQYSVLIRAATTAGEGPHTVALCSTPDEVPPSPLKVEVKEVNERTVTVQWSPVFNGGRPITSYMVQLKNNQAFWNTAVVTELHNPALTQVTLIDLRPAKTYNLRMFAHNIIGQSNSSNVLTITTKEAEPEGSPQDLKLEALSSRSIRATWKPPKAELRNGVLRSYTVSYRTLNQGSRQPSPLMHKNVSATREEESLTLPDLMPSTQYSVLIRAATTAGEGPHAVALCSTPDEVPPSPLKVEVKEVKERTVTVQWSPVFNGGRPITSYMVQLKNNQAFWNTAVVTELHNPALTQVTLIDLRPAKTYNLRMFAHNIIGQSNSSNVLTITTKEAEPEGSPQDLKLEALSSRSIRATWKPPKAELRNGVLRSYTVSYRTLNQGSRQPSPLMHKNVSATREEESLTLTDLMPSTQYSVLIRAATNAGGGPHTVALCSTPDEVPPSPLKVEVKEVKERTVTVQWSPVFNGGRPITSYMVQLKNNQAFWNTAVVTELHNPALTQVTLIDLRPAKTYNLRMFAHNIIGQSNSSNVLTITTKEAEPEGSPQDLKLEALSSRSIRATWKPPKAELRNGVLRSYTVSYRTLNQGSRQPSPLMHKNVSATREEESLTLTDLMPSTQYSVLIRAATTAGEGPHAVALCSTPDEVPPSPLKVEVKEVKERTVTVQWSPVFNGGRPITSYMVQLKNNQAFWNTAVVTELHNPALTQVTLIDLRPAKTYNLRMFAHNIIGQSNSSNVLTITTKEAEPEGSPQDLKLEALSSRSIRATWKPPKAELRNGVLRSYTVSYRTLNQGSRQPSPLMHKNVSATREEESLTLTDLMPSTQYSVLIRAATNAGGGPHTVALCSTPDEVPPSPLKVEVKEVKERTVTVQWSPVFNGGRPITSYMVQLKNNQAFWNTAVVTELHNPALTQVTLIDLRPAKTYNLRMFAHNIIGQSNSSNVLTITTKEAEPEGSPQDLKLEALSSRSIRATWKPPKAELRNGVLRSYTVSYRTLNQGSRQPSPLMHKNVSATREEESLTLTDLMPSTQYSVLIRAATTAGEGPHAVALCSTPDEVPPSPLKVEVKEVKERTVTVQWSPVFNGGRPITSYMVQLKNNQAFWNTAVVTELHNPALTQVTLIDLRPAKTYNLRMFAHNIIGQSNSSNVLTITTKEAEPEGSPQDLKLEALSSRSIRATWKPPKAELRNGVLRSYTVSYRTLNQGSRQPSPLMHKNVSATREEESLTLTDLMPSTQYSVLIRAATTAGGGPHTVALCSTSDEVPPSPLKVEVKEVNERTVTVQWSPVFNGGRPITSYMVQLKNNQAFWNTAVVTELHNPALTQVTLIDLRPAKTYNLRMFAHNIIGQSNSSNVLTITTKEAEPEGSPQDLKLEALSSRSIRATWKPPKAELRNGVLRSYTVSYRTLNQGSRQPSPLMHKNVSATREEESLTLTDLMPSTQYSVLIRAATTAGGGPHTVALCSTSDEVPPSPLKVEVKEVNERTVTVQWSPVFNGGRPITSYMVQLKNNQAFWNTAVVTELHNPALTQVTLIDLRPAKTYNLRMFAHNIIGQSNSSNVLTITTKEAEPEGSPQDLKLEALSSRSIRATWKPPKAELRNGVLRSYTVSYRTLNQGSRQPSPLMHKNVSATREEESLTLTDLMPSTQYSVLIRAATTAGGGPHTVALCSTSDEVPPSPLKVEVKEVKERTVTVQWSPVFNGGRPITSYMVQLKNNQAFWNTAVVTELHNPALTQVTLMDLRPAKTYNLRMFAHNIIGQSNSSNVLTITTKEAEPEGSPQDLKLEALSSRSIRATWKPPKAELRNGVLRSYTVSYRTLNQGSRQPSPLMHKNVSATREEESLTLTDLMPSTQYSVLIRAATTAGEGPHTVALCSTPDEVPPSPLKVEVKEVKERTVTVQWSPVFNGGRPITSYMVQLKNNQAFWNTAVVTELHNPALTQVTLIDLRPAKTYNLRMFAANIIGQSNSSNVLTITTKEAEPEGSPQDLKLEALSSRSIRATWKPPKAELRNGVLRSYTVSYRTLNQGSRQPSPLMHKTVSATREEENLTLTDLMPSTQYSVLIWAATTAGGGPHAVALCSTPDEVLTTTEAETVGSSSPASTKGTQHSTSSIPGSTTPEPDSTSTTVSEQGTASVVAGSTTAAPEPDSTSTTVSEQRTSVVAVSMTAAREPDSTSTAMSEKTVVPGHEKDDLVTTGDSRAAVMLESIEIHLFVVVIPVVLLLLVVAAVITWQCRRVKYKQGKLSLWITPQHSTTEYL